MGKSVSFRYLLCLLPFIAAALAWSASGLLTGTTDPGLLALFTGTVIAFSNLQIHLPRTRIFLSVSHVVILFVLISFSGELAVFLTFVAEVFGATRRTLFEKQPVTNQSLTDSFIAVVTIFATAASVNLAVGYPALELAGLRNGTLLLCVAVLTLVPWLTNSLLMSAFISGETQQPLGKVIRAHSADALLVHSCAAFMAGLFVVALRETNVFLLVTVAGILGLLYIVFRRYGDEQRDSLDKAQKSERERAELAEKHLVDLQGYVEKIEATARDLKESRERFRWAAYHDNLTGLPNRNRIVDEVKLELARAGADEKYRFAFFIIDLKNFKAINESLGRATGNVLIVNIGQRLQESIPLNGTVGRIGGDKFAILVPCIGREADVSVFANQLLDEIVKPFEIDGREFIIRSTLGISIGVGKGEEAEDVLRDAEMAMHRAKERNRRFVVFDQRMLSNAVSALQLETDLRQAVENDEFEIYFQPIVDLQSTRIRGFESLVRWNHPTLGRLLPDKFISIAETTGLIIPMTLQILEKTCVQLVRWNRYSKDTLPLFASVNLSGTHFEHPGLVDHITNALEQTGLDPRLLKLEITETVVMENAEAAISMLRQIKALGVQISIDDFGTGYSSLSYLQRFPIDTLKIDRAFVRSMEDGRQNGEIVRAVLALADAMKLSVVAEGIESIHQLHQLMILSCEYGQGYLFSPPLPANEFELLLDDQSRWRTLTAGKEFTILSPLVPIADANIH